MSDVLVTYKNRTKFDKYYTLPSNEAKNIDDAVSNFTKELITELGSCIFDRGYGTLFTQRLGEAVNVYKVRFILEEEAEKIRYKYGIEKVNVADATRNKKDGFVEVSLEVIFSDVAIATSFDFSFDGSFTDKMILEID